MAARCAKPEKYYIDQETKDYCLFDVGSYWIFQDSATLKTDSRVVIDVRHLMQSSSHRGYIAELYDIDYEWHYQDTNIQIMGDLICYPPIENLFSLILSSEYYSGDLPVYYHYHNDNIGTEHGVRSNKYVLYENFHAFYDVANCRYYNVKQFSASSYKSAPESKAFYAKYVGFIRNERLTDTGRIVSNLIRYNVKPYKK
jgi:hypothetical protein